MRILFIVVIIIQSSFAFTQKATSHEQEILEVINEFRKDPQSFLKNVINPYIENNNLRSNRYARSLIRDLQNQSPLPLFEIDSSLQEMAKDFAVKCGKRGWYGHRNYNERFDKYASHLSRDGENIQYGLKKPKEIVVDLLIDEDVPSLGHRKNLMSKDFSVIGIGFSEHERIYYITVMTFGGYQ
jgi:uncharacterized protein YkwD